MTCWRGICRFSILIKKEVKPASPVGWRKDASKKMRKELILTSPGESKEGGYLKEKKIDTGRTLRMAHKWVNRAKSLWEEMLFGWVQQLKSELLFLFGRIRQERWRREKIGLQGRRQLSRGGHSCGMSDREEDESLNNWWRDLVKRRWCNLSWGLRTMPNYPIFPIHLIFLP